VKATAIPAGVPAASAWQSPSRRYARAGSARDGWGSDAASPGTRANRSAKLGADRHVACSPLRYLCRACSIPAGPFRRGVPPVHAGVFVLRRLAICLRSHSQPSPPLLGRCGDDPSARFGVITRGVRRRPTSRNKEATNHDAAQNRVVGEAHAPDPDHGHLITSARPWHNAASALAGAPTVSIGEGFRMPARRDLSVGAEGRRPKPFTNPATTPSPPANLSESSLP
jgi:hypothetical protein